MSTREKYAIDGHIAHCLLLIGDR